MNTPHAAAAQLAQNMREVISFNRSIAVNSFALVTDSGDPQAVLDALPDMDSGLTAAQALGVYQALHAALVAIGQATGVPAADPSIFQAQQDGTVLYVPPAEPEPEP